jgi:hypothetical protein
MLILQDIMDAISFSKTVSVFGLSNDEIIQLRPGFPGEYIPLPKHPSQAAMARDFFKTLSTIEVDEPKSTKWSYYQALIEDHNLQTAWHDYEQRVYRDVAIHWCEAHHLPYTDKPRRYLWCNRNDIYFLEDNLLKKNSYIRLPNSILEEEKAIFLAELEATGYRAKNPFVANLLDSMIGQTWDEIMAEATRRGMKNAKKRSPRIDEERKWKELNKRFDGNIILLDKRTFRISGTGFAVRILMKSGSMEERKGFVNQNRNDILAWCMEELQERNSIMNRIGDISRYSPAKIILLQTNESNSQTIRLGI